MILIANIFFMVSNSTTRGHTNKLFKHCNNSYTRSNFYCNRVINDWNSLPQFIVLLMNSTGQPL